MIYSNIKLTAKRASATVILVATGLGAAVACSGGSDPTPVRAAQTPRGTTPHAIRVFIKQPDGSNRLAEFGPGTEISPTNSGASATSPSGATSHQLGRHIPIKVTISDAASATTAPTVTDPGTDIDATAWVLVARAAIACGSAYSQTAELPPWGTQAKQWYVYWASHEVPLPNSCDGRLAMEQNLVCVADKLSAIADAVGDVTWPQVGPTDPNYPTFPYTYGESDPAGLQNVTEFSAAWDIPPQADGDRFIARDLAIHTLGMIPIIDSYTDLNGHSCAASFAQVANNELPLNAANIATIHNVFAGWGYPELAPNPVVFPTFPPSNVPYVDSSGQSHMPAIAFTALDLEAQILRSSGRLLHDLIRRDVYSDLAAAAQQSAQALDPTSGNEAAWGYIRPGETGTPYGTIAHAARVLLGRWEIGDKTAVGGAIPTSVADPECEGLPELSLMPGGAFGTDYAARYLDRQIRTKGEQTAVELVERSGLVIPSSMIPSSGDASQLRQVLIDQLQLEEAVQNNVPNGIPATALAEVLGSNNVADADIIFAFERAIRTWELLTNTSDTSASGADGGSTPVCAGGSPLQGDAGSPTALPAGLVMATYPAGWPNAGEPLIADSGLCAVVVQGGLSRSRLATDPMARVGGMTEASQCPLRTAQWDEWGNPTPALLAALPTAQYAYLPPAVFQDAFHIGLALERRLNLLQAAAARLTAQDPTNVSKGGIAELRTWAGTTSVHAILGTTREGVQGFTVTVAGMSYTDDFGVAVTQGTFPLPPEVQNAFGFVYGPPWVAECAANIRQDCPPDFLNAYVQMATASRDMPNNSSGAIANTFSLFVPLSGDARVPMFNAPGMEVPILDPTNEIPFSESHLYMVRLSDPGSQTGKGRVLGTLPLRQSAVGNAVLTGFVDAPMQRELVHDAIDLGRWVGARPPALGDPSAAQTSGYCVDHVPRDLFVPLDNELVSGTQTYEDSWQAYLSLAQTAAQTADALGQQIIANDLLISQNQQAAEEQLANICGDFGAISTATVGTDGKVSADNSDGPTKSCLGIAPDGGTDLVDVVFLGQLPTGIKAQDPTSTAAIKAAIHCPPVGAPGAPPTAVGLCNKATLTADALDIGSPDAGVPANGGDGGDAGPQYLSQGCNDLETVVAPSIRNSFNSAGYLNDLQDPSQTPDAMKSMVSELQMIVDIDNHWQVLYGSEKIMDSRDVAFWPACVGTQCATTGPVDDAGAPPSGAIAAIAPLWSSVFRNCGQLDPTKATLGQCDGDTTTELNMLKWRVTQAIWMLAASGGVLPQGVFYQPIPAVFTDSNVDTPNEGPFPVGPGAAGTYQNAFPVGATNYYSGGVITSSNVAVCRNAPVPCLTLDPGDSISNGGDIGLVTPLYGVQPAFAQFGTNSNINQNGNGEVPFWYSTLYSAAFAAQLGSPPVHILVANAPAEFDQCDVTVNGKTTPFNPGSTCPSTDVSKNGQGNSSSNPTQVPFSAIVGYAVGLDGTSCTYNSGGANTNPTFGTGDPWWQLVGSVKLGLSQSAVWGRGSNAAGDMTELVTSVSAPANVTYYGVVPPGTNQVEIDEGTPNGDHLKAQVVDVGGQWDLASGKDSYGNLINWYPASAYATGVLKPTEWSPPARALSFAGYGAAPNGTCGAAMLLLQASALACTPSAATAIQASTTLSAPPEIQKLSDITALEAWLDKTGTAIRVNTGNFYLQNIPVQVINDIKNKTVGSGSVGGSKGQAILTMEQQITQFPVSWDAIATDLQSISSAIRIANAAIIQAHLSEETTDGQLALQTITTQGNMTLAVDNFLVTVQSALGSAWSSWGQSTAVIPAAALSMADSLSVGKQEIAQTGNMAATAAKTDQNQVDQALALLTSNTIQPWGDIQKQIDSLRGYVAQIDASGQTIKQSEGEAAYQLAIGTGSDFANVDGQEVPIPVDTVLRRQSSALLQRYQAALTNAKGLAYMARRAIEQRIGVTLDSIAQQVGPVDAPASWVDDVCGLQGVNYASLSTAVPDNQDGGGIDGSVDQKAISQFANAWVGDYVAKLQNFVTYYNVQYPSHQGNDTAALSLRYDLLGASAQCTVQAPNVLSNSGDLSQFSSTSWQLTPCDARFQKCLAVVGGYALPSAAGPADTQATGSTTISAGGSSATGVFTSDGSGVTWLLDVPGAPRRAGIADGGGTATSDGGAAASDGGTATPDGASPPDASGGIGTTAADWPSNRVAQQVQLSAGSYVLSWWDQARDLSGNILTQGGTAPPNYVVEVFDSNWKRVATYDNPPYTPPQVGDGGAAPQWSDRRVLSFAVETGDYYTVAFAASAPAARSGDGGLALGSVAIADVQLEQASNGQPSTYVVTTSTTMVTGLDCALTDADFRSAFAHVCEKDGACHYDLTVPFIVDTSALEGSPLDAKLAGGNYNYRHISTALNLVGTGVHSCANDPTPNCYGSGVIQYNLQHDAQNAGIVGYDGNSRVFNFGIANISGGKALAAERYITVPMSSNDQQLLTQPGIQHLDFGGRPMDGTYYLRIWDSPDLNWSALQDIQLIVNYEYWSQIEVSEGRTSRPSRPQLHRAPIRPLIRSTLHRH